MRTLEVCPGEVDDLQVNVLVRGSDGEDASNRVLVVWERTATP